MRIFVLLPLLVVLSGCSKEPILKYEIKGNTVTITDCDESASGKLVIPAKIEQEVLSRALSVLMNERHIMGDVCDDLDVQDLVDRHGFF